MPPRIDIWGRGLYQGNHQRRTGPDRTRSPAAGNRRHPDDGKRRSHCARRIPDARRRGSSNRPADSKSYPSGNGSRLS